MNTPNIQESNKNNNPKVSVIIPCFNREKYIRDCLNSLVSQTYGIANLELILINDASTDQTLSIIQEYEAKFPNAILLINLEEQSGGYVGKVRNIGLSYATGDFITFVDSDDTCMENCIEKLVTAIEKECADCAGCGAVMFQGDNVLKQFEAKNSTYHMENPAEKRAYLMTEGEKCSVWARIYRTSFIQKYNICFDEHLHTAEDVSFHFLAMAYAKTITTIPNYLYLYRASDDSLVRKKVLPTYFTDPFHAISTIYNFMENANLLSSHRKEWEYLYFVRGICEVLLTLDLYQTERPKEISSIFAKAMRQVPNLLQNNYIRTVQGGDHILKSLRDYGFEE